MGIREIKPDTKRKARTEMASTNAEIIGITS